MTFLTIFGTRPEAIKCAPLIHELSKRGCKHHVCVTGQHRQMLDQILNVFSIRPDFDLNVMRSNQSLAQMTGDMVPALNDVITKVKPDWVFVQGDTSTAFTGALAAFYNKVKVAHVEAGLRTGNMLAPWPEEGNRKLVGALATTHFAPTDVAANNLYREGVAKESVVVTGNTVIDALQMAVEILKTNSSLRAGLEKEFAFLNAKKKLVLVTGHRRESFGGGFDRICAALAQVAKRDDVEVVYPVHLNPQVKDVVFKTLGGAGNIHLLPPAVYLAFVYLMQKSHLILTDSGGVQEEAPTLGKPVLVMRDVTERPEAVAVGTSELVGTATDKIIDGVERLLDDTQEYERRRKIKNPYGDGSAAARIVSHLLANQEASTNREAR